MEETLKGRLDALIALTQANASIDYTAKFDTVISELQDIDANTVNLENILNNIKLDTGAITTNTGNTVTELQNVIVELQGIDANTNGVEGLLSDIITELQKPLAELVAPTVAEPKCIEVLGVKMWGTPVLAMNTTTGVLGATQWLDESMSPITDPVIVLPACDCPCSNCAPVAPCVDNPPDYNITDVGGNTIYRAWTTQIAGLSDYAVTDVGGSTIYWAMSSAICTTAVPQVDVGANTTYYVLPA